MERFEQRIGEPVAENIVYKKSFAHSDFVSEYHSFKGNAYGLANTLWQTAILKPACRSKKIKTCFHGPVNGTRPGCAAQSYQRGSGFKRGDKIVPVLRGGGVFFKQYFLLMLIKIPVVAVGLVARAAEYI